MKFLKIMQFIGYIALLLGVIINIVNQATSKTVLAIDIAMFLMVVALVGIICGVIYLVKSKGK